MERPDDAGIYRIQDDLALVQTIDFFTPIVDDPFTFGRIAAVNALSDVYAMGGRPLCAMNVVCFPSKTMKIDVLREILRGGLHSLEEAATPLVGGHSVEDPELKYGLSVTGRVHPDRVLSSAGARAGDRLVLTKPLGTGIVSTALKKGACHPDAAEAAVDSMTSLNRQAAELLRDREVHACTDVTGFGLLGHAHEMVQDAEVDLVLHAGAIPLLPRVEEYAARKLAPGGLKRNREFVGDTHRVDGAVPPGVYDAICDPQTSGGLLVSLPPDEAARYVDALRAAGMERTATIGEVVEGGRGTIRIRP
jgi:selenide,water dikinase